MKNLFLFLLMAPVLAMAHPIHVSVCEITHNTDEQQLEITIKIFADDFSHVLSDRTGETIVLGAVKENVNTDLYIKEYLDEKFILTINGQAVSLVFDRKEVEDVAVWCYLSVDGVSKIQSVALQNSVMIHWFSDQVNVVHLDCNDKMNSTFFSKGKEVDEFVFD